MTIRILGADVANQIAAGEVVERPASVVKELVENALDARANTISVTSEGAGRRLIEVADNGDGIPADELHLAFQRHATSKISHIDDLNQLYTLGFRGEALASIASVSRTTVISRALGEDISGRMLIEGGHILVNEPTGAPQGTMITVENLFYNTPARLKFLKKDATERQHISALVSRYAMAYPQVRFSLSQEGREVLRTSGNGHLEEVLLEVFGLETVQQMLPIQSQADERRPDRFPVVVNGHIGQPSLNRANRSQITVFVNGRWVQDSSLTYAVVQAYHTMLMTGRYPVAVVLIDVPPHEIDINVHPTKAQVRFRRPEVVFSAVQRAVRRTLVDHTPVPQLSLGSSWGSPDWAARRDRLTQVTTQRMTQLGFDADGTMIDPPDDDDEPATGPPRPRRNLPLLRVVGQIGATYIVCEGPSGLYLIDQHAAHERILYEQFSAERANEQIMIQELLEPVVIDLIPEHMDLINANVHLLEQVGFRVETFGRNSVQLRAVPVMVAQGDPAEALMAAIGDIECGDMPMEATAEQKMIARICKQVAVKAGQVLSPQEMQGLIRQLEACEAPRSCPHGRPTLLHLSAEQLAKEFGRLGAI
ncbi:MAG: DNA mismatch repair endonuclease MutL [Chloroflexi bacterium]|nr:DNA mismatch repair endonuclease MutL [Chloroflexota bacterium]